MTDMVPMAPCPVGKRGRHDLTYLFNDSPDGWLTMACDRCGMARRVPMSGELERPLDDASADYIASLVLGTETR